MFCMGCGAETPPRASACQVCGRPLGGPSRPDEVPPAAGTAPRASTSAADAGSRLTQHAAAARDLAPIAARATTGPSIGKGDLTTTGFPRDTLGRAVIFTVLAMCADLVAPWVNLDGTRIAPSAVGLPILGVVVVLGVAALPVTRPTLRATPLYAAAPLVIGAASFGSAGAVWLRTALSTSGGSAASDSFQVSPAYIADVGLYLFLAGAIVLVSIGYQFFLAAARASALAELRATALAPVTHAAAPAPASVSGAAPAPTAAPVFADLADTTAAHPPEGNAAAAGADGLPPAANGHHRPEIALPGSPAWSQAPSLPAYQRPSPTLGWRRRGS